MKDLTKGKPIKVLLLFAIPLFIGYMFQQLYSLVDTMIVGNYLGDQALAAVGSTNAITNMMLGFVNGMANGFAIIVARYFGAGDKANMRKSIGGMVSLSALLTISIMTGAFFFMMPLLRLLQTPESIIDKSWMYIMIIVSGMVFTSFYNVQASILRAVGNTVMPLVFLMISASINIGLDILFVRYLGFGIAGAAVATVIAQGISGVCCFIYIIVRCKEIRFAISDLFVSWSMFGQLMNQGLAMGFMSCFVSIGSVILQSAINGFGEYTIAAHTTARKVFEFCDIPLFVTSMASATFASQNMGAGRFDRVKQGLFQACIITTVWSILMLIMTWTFAPSIIHFVSGSDELEVINLGSRYIMIASCFYIILGVLLVIRNVMQGIGYTIPPIVTSALELIGKVLSVVYLTPHLGYFGVMLTEPTIWVICGVTLVVLFFLGMNKYQRIADENLARVVEHKKEKEIEEMYEKEYVK